MPYNFKTIDNKLKQAISKLFKDNSINTGNKIQKQIKEQRPFLAYYLINSQFPKGQVLSDNNEFEFLNNINSNNLWLFDDRFASYKYAFSNKAIKNIKEKFAINHQI